MADDPANCSSQPLAVNGLHNFADGHHDVILAMIDDYTRGVSMDRKEATFGPLHRFVWRPTPRLKGGRMENGDDTKAEHLGKWVILPLVRQLRGGPLACFANFS